MVKPVKEFNELAVKSVDEFIYGTAPNPVKARNGMVIGGGTLYPEVNLTLPTMNITEATMPQVRRQYKDMIEGILKRAKELFAPGLVIELELLPPTTINPQWGAEVHKILRDAMFEYEEKYGLKSAMRCTPNDTREMMRPPFMKKGEFLDNMYKTFAATGKDGADFFSIESTGGKEVHDEGLVNCDLKKVIFGLGVLGVHDMRFLWGNIVNIAKEYGVVPAGDTACGFANTALALAEQGLIPRVFAAVDRVASVPRTLAAYEMGALGPNKDCGYEGPYIKAITGSPIAMEGKSAACAHLSAMGNISACVADLWSNESVQNVMLLSAPAPTVCTEMLIYDCRLMNGAKAEGMDSALKLRNWLANSDSKFDPQAYVIRPDVVLNISKELVKVSDPLVRTKLAASLAIEEIKKGIAKEELILPEKESRWLDIMSAQLENISEDPEELWSDVQKELNLTTWIPGEYELKIG